MKHTRFHIGLAITLAGVAVGGIVAKLFLQDERGREAMDQLLLTTVVGGFAGTMIALYVDRVYKARPGSRRAITLLAGCALSAGFGGLYGWHLGVDTAFDPLQLAITADQKMRVVRRWTAIGGLVGLGVGLPLSAFYLAIHWMLAFHAAPKIEGDSDA